MIFVVAPERSAWLEPLRRSLGACHVFSPRALHLAAGVASRAWARGAADRILALRFARRRIIGALAARALPRDATAVYAPSGAAERVFAVARARGIETVLVHDLPSIRELHEDLDEAAARFPDCRFLRRFRASRDELVRQESERALADRVLVRGAWARALVTSRCEANVERLPEDAPRLSPRLESPKAPAFWLAGFAAARNGTNEALAMLDALPHATLLVRAGEGTEPARLLAHPRVRAATDLGEASAVIAPAWCESYSPEIDRAAALGIPVIATERALGFARGTVIARGDASALVAAAARITC
jgi:hypothetical protein